MRRVRQCISSTIILRSNLQREEVRSGIFLSSRSFCSSRLTSFGRCCHQSPPIMEGMQTPETEIRKNRKEKNRKKGRRGENWWSPLYHAISCDKSCLQFRLRPRRRRTLITLHSLLLSKHFLQAMGFSALSFVGGLRSIATLFNSIICSPSGVLSIQVCSLMTKLTIKLR